MKGEAVNGTQAHAHTQASKQVARCCSGAKAHGARAALHGARWGRAPTQTQTTDATPRPRTFNLPLQHRGLHKPGVQVLVGPQAVHKPHLAVALQRRHQPRQAAAELAARGGPAFPWAAPATAAATPTAHARSDQRVEHLAHKGTGRRQEQLAGLGPHAARAAQTAVRQQQRGGVRHLTPAVLDGEPRVRRRCRGGRHAELGLALQGVQLPCVCVWGGGRHTRTHTLRAKCSHEAELRAQ